MKKKIIFTTMQYEGTTFGFCGLFEDHRAVQIRLEPCASGAAETRRPDRRGSSIGFQDTNPPAGGHHGAGHKGSENPNQGRNPAGSGIILGGIYIGRVERIVQNLNAAFVEIAPGCPCYFPFEGNSNPVYIRKQSASAMVQGDEILVQVQREALKTKRPTVTSNLTLQGRFCVISQTPGTNGVSSKLGKAKREHFRSLLAELPDTGRRVVIRTSAQEADDPAVLSEIRTLNARMDEILDTAPTRACFSCLYRPAPKWLTFLQNISAQDLEEIVTDDAGLYGAISAFCAENPDLTAIPLRLYTDASFPMSSLYSLQAVLSAALSKKVWLKSGGFLVIEPTEALTVIDVNTGKSDKKIGVEELFYHTNLEAAVEIAHQLRLRNISGIVIVDFIDMKDPGQEQKLLETLRAACKKDPVPVSVLGFTRLGLAELTRKKAEKSLYEQVIEIKNKG